MFSLKQFYEDIIHLLLERFNQLEIVGYYF